MEPPQLELARKQALALKTNLINGDADAMARIRATHPDMRFVPDDAFPIASAGWFANRAVAREAGFNNWIHLTRHIAAGGLLPPQTALADMVAAVERPDRDTVREMLTVHPHLAAARIWNVDNPLGDTLLHRADANAPRGAPWENRDQTTDAHRRGAGAHRARRGRQRLRGRGDIIAETPVGAAGWAGNLRMVEFLLQHGANPTVVTDDWGFDALTSIAGHHHPDIVEAIIDAGWPVEPRHLVQAGLKDRLTVPTGVYVARTCTAVDEQDGEPRPLAAFRGGAAYVLLGARRRGPDHRVRARSRSDRRGVRHSAGLPDLRGSGGVAWQDAPHRRLGRAAFRIDGPAVRPCSDPDQAGCPRPAPFRLSCPEADWVRGTGSDSLGNGRPQGEDQSPKATARCWQARMNDLRRPTSRSRPITPS